MTNPIPWIALAAVAAMFVLPWLDARGLFDGPRTIRHWPQRHVCGDCAEPWASGHQCPGWLKAAECEPVVPLHPVEPWSPPARAELPHPDQPERPALPQPERRP